MRRQIDLNWMVGAHADKNAAPDRFIAAAVPGAVQLDFAKADGYADYHYSDNYKQFLWMEDGFFTYKTTFDVENPDGIYFVSKGIDYRFDIVVNQTLVLEHEGMFSPIRCDISPYIKAGENTLMVIIYPVPKSHKDKADRSQANASVKPAVSYGWDFHPRLIPSGIWDETYIEQITTGFIEDVSCDIFVDEDLSAEMRCDITTQNANGATLKVALIDPNGDTVFTDDLPVVNNQANFKLSLQNPMLWWPNEHGEQNLYTLKTELLDSDRIVDSKESKKGFRRIELILPKEAIEDDPFPKTRYPAPIAIKINNKVIFAKGSNWVCPTIFPGTLKREDYDYQLKLMRDAHMNIVRCWGGAIVNKEDFFELCDKYGIIVWQEFPLSCNNYKSTPHYLNVLRQEAAAIVKRLKEHPSVGIWCGGNELFCPWSGMDDQSLALRTLNKICLELDPYTPFLPTAPLYGMGHGCYKFRFPKDGVMEDILQIFNRSKKTAYSEFGCPSASNLDTLRSIIPKEEWDSCPGSYSWKVHHADKAWANAMCWFEVDTVKYYFGEDQTIEQLVEYTRLLQGVGYKYAFEEARRQAPRCSMALNWCYNEPWKTAANNNIIEFDGTVKPAYYEIKKALRKNLLSLRAKRFDYTDGDTFFGEVWLLSEEDFKLDRPVTVKLITNEGEREIITAKCSLNSRGKNKLLFSFNLKTDSLPKGAFTIALRCEDESLNSEYLFVKR